MTVWRDEDVRLVVSHTHLMMLYDPNMKPMVRPTPAPIMAPILNVV